MAPSLAGRLEAVARPFGTRSELEGEELEASVLGRVDDVLPRVSRKILVFLGDRPQRIDGVEVLPLRAFLEELPT